MVRAGKILFIIGVVVLASWAAKSLLSSPSSDSPVPEEVAKSPAAAPVKALDSPVHEKSPEAPASSPALTAPPPQLSSESQPPPQENSVAPQNTDTRREHIKAQMVVMGSLDGDVIIDFMDRRQPQLSHCYERAIGEGQSISGRIIVRLMISPLGRVVEAAVDTKFSTIENPRMRECVLGIVKRMIFPEPLGGGSVEVDYPFTFPLPAKEGT